MAKYTGPSNKLFRNYGVTDLSNRKLVSSLRQTASGQHGAARKKLSDYAINKAARTKGVTGTVLLQLLERRVDNVLFRAGFATTRKQARQIVNHGHVLVNGKKVDIPSYLVKAGDIITIRTRSAEFVKTVMESLDVAAPQWMTVDAAAQKIVFDRIPEREELDPEFKEQLVIEYYSK